MHINGRTDAVTLRAWTLMHRGDALLHVGLGNHRGDREQRAGLVTILVAEAIIAIAHATEQNRRVTIGTFCHGGMGMSAGVAESRPLVHPVANRRAFRAPFGPRFGKPVGANQRMRPKERG